MPHIQLGDNEEDKGTLQERHLFNPLATLHATAAPCEGMVSLSQVVIKKVLVLVITRTAILHTGLSFQPFLSVHLTLLS